MMDMNTIFAAVEKDISHVLTDLFTLFLQTNL